MSAVYGIPVQETPEVAAARAAHNAAHATARALNALPPVASPVFLQQPVQDTPEVWAAKAEHYRVCLFSNEFVDFILSKYFCIFRLTLPLPLLMESLPRCPLSSLITCNQSPILLKFGPLNKNSSAPTMLLPIVVKLTIIH